jgi:hypothetical protein
MIGKPLATGVCFLLSLIQMPVSYGFRVPRKTVHAAGTDPALFWQERFLMCFILYPGRKSSILVCREVSRKTTAHQQISRNRGKTEGDYDQVIQMVPVRCTLYSFAVRLRGNGPGGYKDLEKRTSGR